MVLFIDTNRGKCGGTAHGMAVISETPVKHFVLKMLRDVMPHADCAQRQVAGSESLCHAEKIGNNFPMIHREPCASAAEARHHFIGDHQDAILLAELAHAFEDRKS